MNKDNLIRPPVWLNNVESYQSKLNQLAAEKSWGLRVTREGDIVGANLLRLCFESFKGSWPINKLFGSLNWARRDLLQIQMVEIIALGEKNGWIKRVEAENIQKLAHYIGLIPQALLLSYEEAFNSSKCLNASLHNTKKLPNDDQSKIKIVRIYKKNVLANEYNKIKKQFQLFSWIDPWEEDRICKHTVDDRSRINERFSRGRDLKINPEQSTPTEIIREEKTLVLTSPMSKEFSKITESFSEIIIVKFDPNSTPERTIHNCKPYILSEPKKNRLLKGGLDCKRGHVGFVCALAAMTIAYFGFKYLDSSSVRFEDTTALGLQDIYQISELNTQNIINAVTPSVLQLISHGEPAQYQQMIAEHAITEQSFLELIPDHASNLKKEISYGQYLLFNGPVLLLGAVGIALLVKSYFKQKVLGHTDSVIESEDNFVQEASESEDNFVKTSEGGAETTEIKIKEIASPLSSYLEFKSPYAEISSSSGRPDEFIKVVNEIKKRDNQCNFNVKIFTDNEGYKLNIAHSRYEIFAYCCVYPELANYLFCTRQTVPRPLGNITRAGFDIGSDNSSVIVKKLKKVYKQISKNVLPLPFKASPVLSIDFCKNFLGKEEELNEIFTNIFFESEGVVVGEYYHKEKIARHVLIQQMNHFYSLGVRTLFLEHACYDTLQPELDQFFRLKNASPFLEDFLKNGYGGCIGYENHFDLVKAAVEAGIRPVGLELSTTQDLGYDAMGGSSEDARMLGLNLPGKEIIEREKGHNKYLALVGAAHASYAYDVAGFSELCSIHSVVIKEAEKNKTASINYITEAEQNQMSSHLNKELKNKKHKFSATVYLSLKEPSTSKLSSVLSSNKSLAIL